MPKKEYLRSGNFKKVLLLKNIIEIISQKFLSEKQSKKLNQKLGGKNMTLQVEIEDVVNLAREIEKEARDFYVVNVDKQANTILTNITQQLNHNLLPLGTEFSILNAINIKVKAVKYIFEVKEIDADNGKVVVQFKRKETNNMKFEFENEIELDNHLLHFHEMNKENLKETLLNKTNFTEGQLISVNEISKELFYHIMTFVVKKCTASVATLKLIDVSWSR